MNDAIDLTCLDDLNVEADPEISFSSTAFKSGYFRLIGRLGDDSEFDEVVDIIPLTLGRKENCDGHLKIGGETALSREHAKIYWNNATGEEGFYFEALSKNTCIVNQQICIKGTVKKISSKSALKIGGNIFCTLIY